ncbi:response regulator transcription factor [Halobaculum magnesiiphilum]|uniref:Response regulator transcription factor n=1 Tax=Halobaculum magnesiiphilum TaxID=1017351 RepID=A0A8T8WFG1_9EURY|nr:response regulator transcription factor [Halobaculum magnesiiphilum]QZP38597.1 response regulator transcription factor [Halobaculum magnesiiphilum]
MSEDTDTTASESAAERPVVLVVEDEPDLADLYAAWLGGDYEVRTAYGGQAALEELDDAVDVILLDRRMPGLSGDEVLDEVRDRGIDARVAMVTAVEPDFDIIEMGFDDYLVKPVTRESLLDTVEGLYTRSTYDSRVQEFFAVSSKMAVLEAEKGRAALEESAEYETLERRAATLREELDEDVAGFGDDEFERVFRDLDGADADGDLVDDDEFEDI